MVENQWHMLDWVATFMYLGGMIWVGWYVSRKVKNSTDFLMAGRSLTFPMVVATIAATWYGSGAVFGTAQLAYTSGIVAFVFWCIPAHLGRIPLALWVAPKVRGIKETTIPSLLGRLYAKPVAILGAILIICYSTRIMDIVSVGVMGNVVTGLPNWSVAAIIVGVVILYSLFGGLWSVVMTDVFQFLLMTSLSLLLLVPVWSSVGGFEGLSTIIPEGHFRPLGDLGIKDLAVYFILGFQVYADPAAYQRFGASNSAQTAKRSYLTCLLIWLAFDAVMTLLGLSARAIYPDLQPNVAFLTMAINNLPPFFTGLWMCSILAVIMSTMSSFYLVGATTMAVDLVKPLFKPDMSDRDQINYTRIFMVFIGACGVGMAFQFKTVLDAVVFLGGLYIASAFVPVLGGLFWRGRRTVAGGFLAMLMGMTTTIVWQFMLGNPFGLKPILVALPVSFIFFIIGNTIGQDIRTRDNA
ncbi:sodium:solute symporter family protein [Desulfovibrio sp. OttesenSCG-928-I05]|nr:sodium:solute symporter family protein [Desulfovibrio sp. OttesenSCG-928-I05]